jgi:hypothetical protein
LPHLAYACLRFYVFNIISGLFANRHFLKCTYLLRHACLPARPSVCLSVCLIVHMYLTISRTTDFEFRYLRFLL